MSRRFGLVIGNSAFRDSTLARLVTPDVDVGDLADLLLNKDVGNFDDVKVLVNSSSFIARRVISEFFSEKKRDDLLLLYFSGHGVLDDQGRLFLATKDTERKLLRATSIPSNFITDEMNNSRSQRQVLILDCCHSGAFARGAKGVTGATVGTAAAFEGTGYGRVVLTATDATQYAWEGDQVLGAAENSVFTKYLVKGLRSGDADLNNDGQITIDELFDYVEAHILDETPKQTPGKWTYKEHGEIILARNPSYSIRPEEVYSAQEIEGDKIPEEKTEIQVLPPETEKPPRRKFPAWVWILIGVIGITIIGFLFSKFLIPFIPFPQDFTPTPTVSESVFDMNSAILTLTSQAEQTLALEQSGAVIQETITPEPSETEVITARLTQLLIPSDTPQPTPFFTALISAHAANLRSGPGVVYTVVTSLSEGNELKVLGSNEERTWLKVELQNGDQAWIAMSVVEITFDPNDLTEIEAPPTPTSPPPVPTKTRKPKTYGGALYIPPELNGENPVASINNIKKIYIYLLTSLVLIALITIENRKVRQNFHMLRRLSRAD